MCVCISAICPECGQGFFITFARQSKFGFIQCPNCRNYLFEKQIMEALKIWKDTSGFGDDAAVSP